MSHAKGPFIHIHMQRFTSENRTEKCFFGHLFSASRYEITNLLWGTSDCSSLPAWYGNVWGASPLKIHLAFIGNCDPIRKFEFLRKIRRKMAGGTQQKARITDIFLRSSCFTAVLRLCSCYGPSPILLLSFCLSVSVQLSLLITESKFLSAAVLIKVSPGTKKLCPSQCDCKKKETARSKFQSN